MERSKKRRGRKIEANLRRMDKIVFDKDIRIGEEVLIEGPPMEALRFRGVRKGSLLTITDISGNDFRGRVTYIDDEKASIIIFDKFPSPTESTIEIILLQALPDKERMELIIQKTTELGVSKIIPFKSAKSISLEEREAKQKKAHRWQEIARRASEQCRRRRIPKVESVRGFQEVIELCENDSLKIILWERQGEGLKGLLRRNTFKKIYIMVGPEGGFTDDEVFLAMKHGFKPVKLGQRILRTETASIILVGILQYELGDLN